MNTTHFDSELDEIPHFTLYPTLKPWVGHHYCSAPVKLLILGESHYLKSDSTYHHDSQDWYGGVDVSHYEDLGWMNTRTIIQNGIKTQWESRSKTIYRNIASALSGALEAPDTPFMSVTFMNYFQRPAEKTGDSISVSSLDTLKSAETVRAVAKVVSPDAVIFCSTLAWKSAKSTTLLDDLRSDGVMVRASNHPASAWWNRPSKRLKRRTGKTAFIEAVLAAVACKKKAISAGDD